MVSSIKGGSYMRMKVRILLYLIMISCLITVGCKKDEAKQGNAKVSIQPTEAVSAPTTTMAPIQEVTEAPSPTPFSDSLANTIAKEDYLKQFINWQQGLQQKRLLRILFIRRLRTPTTD